MQQLLRTICFLLLGGSTLQAAGVLDRHIDVRFQQTLLKEALTAVAQQAGFEWSYNANIIDGTKKVSLIANDWTVRETLYELLGEGYEFKPTGNYLILKKRRKPAEELSGYLKDPRTGQRVVNATVYDRRTLRATTTDSNGYYALRVKKSTRIAIARLDYRDTIFSVNTGSPRFQKFDLQVNASPSGPDPDWREGLQRAATQTERFFRASLEKWNALNVPDSLHRRYQVSFLPKIGTNHTLSGKVTNDWSLNILAGTAQGNRRFELAGIGNFTRKDMTGLQVAGVFNELRGNTAGVQVAGIYNRTGDTLSGVQVAGIVNRAAQSRGFALQVGGIGNFVGHSRGVTVQVGGILNRCDQIQGLQVAGVVNMVDTLEGMQVAAVCNRARKVKGFQFGLFNTADELEGLQIGLLNRAGRRVLPLVNWSRGPR